MHLQDISTTLRRLAERADGWTSAGRIPAIERDLALEALRHLYDELQRDDAAAPVPEPLGISLDELFAAEDSEQGAVEETAPLSGEEPSSDDAETAPPSEPEPFPEPEPESASEHLSDAGSDPLLSEGPVSLSEPAPEALPPSEPEPLPEPEPATEPLPEVESEPEEEAPQFRSVHAVGKSAERETPHREAVPSLFGPEDPEEQRRHRHKQRILMSLYDMPAECGRAAKEAVCPALRAEARHPEPSEEPGPSAVDPAPVTPADGPAVSAAPVADGPDSGNGGDAGRSAAAAGGRNTVLGETLLRCGRTLGDELAAPQHDVASELVRNEPVEDLRKALGLNDRFLLIRDLFGDDAETYERTLALLNDMASLDDCLVYIAEHFDWNASSEGAKLLMALLERKYS